MPSLGRITAEICHDASCPESAGSGFGGTELTALAQRLGVFDSAADHGLTLMALMALMALNFSAQALAAQGAHAGIRA